MTVPTPEDIANSETDHLYEVRLTAKAESLLLKHPLCSDPDHPGCPLCDPTRTIVKTTVGQRRILTLRKPKKD